MAELEHKVDETKREQDVAVSEQGAATPHDGGAKVSVRQVVPHNKRLFAALLSCLVIGLVALGVWAFQSFGGSAALTTVAPQETKAGGDVTDARQATSDDQTKREKSGQVMSAKPEQQAPETQAQPAQSLPVASAQPASDPIPATQDASAGDPVVTTVVEEPAPASEQAAAPTPEPVPESSVGAVTEPAPEPAPAPEPVAMTIRVSVDGTPAGGGYRDATVTLAPGANVYDALLATGAGVNARGSVYGTYVAAIDGLAEKDHGGMSGWVYAVNGVEPQTACSNYKLSDGDVVAWLYVNAEY